MTSRRRARLATGLLSVVLLTALGCGKPDDRAAPPRPVRDLAGLEALVQPAVPGEDLTQSARDFLASLGYECSGLVGTLRPDLDLDALDAFREEQPDERILAFAERGAPLVRWRATFLGPEVSDGPRLRLTVLLDAQGSIRGFSSLRHSPLPYPDGTLEEWTAETLGRIAGWMAVDPETLESMGGADARGSASRRVHAMWSMRDVSLDDSNVIVVVDQGPDSYNFYQSLSPRPGATSDGPLSPTPGEEPSSPTPDSAR